MVGKLLADARKARGLSQPEAARALDISTETISNWEREVTDPRCRDLIRLASLYQVPPASLLPCNP